MTSHQVGILAPGPSLGRFLFFQLAPDDDPRDAVKAIQELDADEDLVVGLGRSLVLATGSNIDGLRVFPSLTGPGIEVPSTQAAVWCWLRGKATAVNWSTGRSSSNTCSNLSRCPASSTVSSTTRRRPDGEETYPGTKTEPRIRPVTRPLRPRSCRDVARGLDGSSFVAVQTWQHDLVGFQAMTQDERDNVIGRRLSDNEELEHAPDSAHVKRTAQESFEPEAFVVRQSMPWADPDGEGLVFVSFGRTLDAFEAQLTRMVGLDDGIVDGLFRFSRPVSGGYYWCPPIHGGKLDLRALTS